jgi:lipopolysaccharide/colanic/teichoic acid biosynthesis glycosyltransferase
MKKKENTLIKKCENILIRISDIILVTLALLALSPVLLPTVIVLRLTGEGYVLYRQERIGRKHKKFLLLKFATMLKDSPNIGAGSITLKNDLRVLPLGKILRATKINELPQLINVLRGEMSLIGPRPLTADNYGYYSTETKKVLSSVRPGLSGVGSIVFRNEERLLVNQEPHRFYRDVISPYKGELECWYVRHRSLGLYFKLILLTVLCVIVRNTNPRRYLGADFPEPTAPLRELLSGKQE